MEDDVLASGRRWIPLALVAWGTVCILALAFLHLGTEVVEGETQSFDKWVAHAAAMLREAHPWLSETMRDLTGLGSTAVLGLVTIVACGYLWMKVERVTAVIVAALIPLATLCVQLFKSGIDRLRPDIGVAGVVAYGPSFPSGHSSLSAVVFLTIGALLARQHARGVECAYIVRAAALVTVLVGISRVLLGVHWATDVIGGWAFGTACALAGLLFASRLAR